MASTGEVWKLGHRPALDGVRGVAVLLVVVSHLSESSLRPVGMGGVVVFFVLSGFLITSLLLEEHEKHGRVDLRRFYLRRARRLAPALVAFVAAATAVGVLVPGFMPGRYVLAVLTWSSNWLLATGDGQESAIVHTWSLGIEEQFYLLWPLVLLVLLAARRRGLLVGVLAVGIVVSAGERFVLISHGWERVYYASDTRADGLLVGCLVAVLLHGRPLRVRLSRGWLVVAVVLPFAGCASWLVAVTVLPALMAVVSVAVVLVAVQDERVAGLSWGPLVWCGRRSYGLYLWHWPVLLLLRTELERPAWWLLAAVGLPVSVGLTVLSWRYVEQPWLVPKAQARPPEGCATSQASRSERSVVVNFRL